MRELSLLQQNALLPRIMLQFSHHETCLNYRAPFYYTVTLTILCGNATYGHFRRAYSSLEYPRAVNAQLVREDEPRRQILERTPDLSSIGRTCGDYRQLRVGFASYLWSSLILSSRYITLMVSGICEFPCTSEGCNNSPSFLITYVVDRYPVSTLGISFISIRGK